MEDERRICGLGDSLVLKRRGFSYPNRTKCRGRNSELLRSLFSTQARAMNDLLPRHTGVEARDAIGAIEVGVRDGHLPDGLRGGVHRHLANDTRVVWLCT